MSTHPIVALGSTPAAPVSTSAGHPPAATDAEADRFQRLLQQADPRRQAADKAQTGRQAAKPGSSAAPRDERSAEDAASAAAGAVSPAEPGVVADAAAPSATDPAAMPAALQAPSTPLPAAAPRSAGELATGGSQAAHGATARGRAQPADGAPEAASAAASCTASLARPTADTMQLQTLADTAPRQAEAPQRVIEATPPLPLAPSAPPANTVTASAPAEARIAASPGSADFATQLGVQLTTFVREGVQNARLELHPLELGPVTVQILLDGLQAQVNLSAELGDTRQALEQALPQLAGSLREAGLTLTGGGVSEQPRQAPQGSPTRDTRRNPPIDEDERSTALSVPALRRRGVVDLVA